MCRVRKINVYHVCEVIGVSNSCLWTMVRLKLFNHNLLKAVFHLVLQTTSIAYDVRELVQVRCKSCAYLLIKVYKQKDNITERSSDVRVMITQYGNLGSIPETRIHQTPRIINGLNKRHCIHK